MLREAVRWFVRRDTEASGTLLGGWIGKFEQIISIIVGVEAGLTAGVLVYAFLWMLKAIVGYIDIYHLKATAYRNYYISEKAPSNVIVIRKPKRA
jgi:hypothetical protein